MPEADAAKVPYNPFDPTKIWPHKDYPLIEVGVMELNRNPENLFAEVEQSAFNPANVVPGIGFRPTRWYRGGCSPMAMRSATASASITTSRGQSSLPGSRRADGTPARRQVLRRKPCRRRAKGRSRWRSCNRRCTGLDLHQANVVACLRMAEATRASHEVARYAPRIQKTAEDANIRILGVINDNLGRERPSDS